MEKRFASFTEEMYTYPREEGSLIPLLQKAQSACGYISPAIVETLADYLQLTESEVFGVASFYSQFRFTEPGRHSISVCLGTACHVVGGGTLLETCERDLEVKPGECTSDKRFDLNRVACLGCCALAPVVKIDDDIHSKVNIIKLKEMWSNYE
ncbi:MAG: NAD(P)H-dependent oxidoreductase subunit E [Bacteroidetes bacterium]|nr:MAG: NAD(P)H-dependent oxidoreductase subunit E [Bacteroidota bacterium]